MIEITFLTLQPTHSIASRVCLKSTILGYLLASGVLCDLLIYRDTSLMLASLWLRHPGMAALTHCSVDQAFSARGPVSVILTPSRIESASTSKNGKLQ